MSQSDQEKAVYNKKREKGDVSTVLPNDWGGSEFKETIKKHVKLMQTAL